MSGRQVERWRVAWVAQALAIALHVMDEALTGFLPVYNGIVAGLRHRHQWLPLPTFTFPVWLLGLTLGVLLLLALTPLVSRERRWLRIGSLVLATLMTANALGHLGASLYWRRPAPGVTSSPVLLVAAIALFVTARNARAGDPEQAVPGVAN